MSDKIDILLVGLGSIGTVFSYILERSGKARVTAVARSNYELYTTTGSKLVTDRFGTIEGYRPSRVFKSQAEALADGTQYSVCVLCTKCLPDVLPNAQILETVLASNQVSSIALIQNGLGVEDDLAAVTKLPIISCLAWVGIVTNPSGDTVTWRGVEKLGGGVFRADGCTPTAQEQAALDLWMGLVAAGGGNTVVTDNIRSLRYSKNVWTATQASIQGLLRGLVICFKDLAEEHHVQIKKFYREVVTVGFKTGLLYEGMIVQPSGAACQGIEEIVQMDFDRFVLGQSTHKWSLLIDVEQNRPIEVEVILGSVVRLAHEHNIDIPLVEFVYTLLKGLQVNTLNSQK